jgi:hypothetical protein
MVAVPEGSTPLVPKPTTGYSLSRCLKAIFDALSLALSEEHLLSLILRNSVSLLSLLTH